MVKEYENNYVYGYTVEEWNNFSYDEQIAIEQREEYNMLHSDQAEWFID